MVSSCIDVDRNVAFKYYQFTVSIINIKIFFYNLILIKGLNWLKIINIAVMWRDIVENMHQKNVNKVKKLIAFLQDFSLLQKYIITIYIDYNNHWIYWTTWLYSLKLYRKKLDYFVILYHNVKALLKHILVIQHKHIVLQKTIYDHTCGKLTCHNIYL